MAASRSANAVTPPWIEARVQIGCSRVIASTRRWRAHRRARVRAATSSTTQFEVRRRLAPDFQVSSAANYAVTLEMTCCRCNGSDRKTSACNNPSDPTATLSCSTHARVDSAFQERRLVDTIVSTVPRAVLAPNAPPA
jgi:hypothetical protein